MSYRLAAQAREEPVRQGVSTHARQPVEASTEHAADEHEHELPLGAVVRLKESVLEHRQHPSTQLAGNNQPARPIILVVLGDHLDRSERLLVELNHANDVSAVMPVKAEAQDLLSANRLYRESATRAGDPQLTAALDRLERVLVEIVNAPDSSSPAQLARLQKEMNIDGLLFEVRVLRSRIPDQQKNSTVRTKGVSI